jgi:iron complex transport system substrate-binding protein
MRIAALDWELAETLLSLSIRPIAIPQIVSYRDWVENPWMLDGVLDLGRIEEPNLELLQQLHLDFILATPDQAKAIPALREIARTLTITIYSGDRDPYSRAYAETDRLAHALGSEAAWLSLRREIVRFVEAAAGKLTRVRSWPLYIASFVDEWHIAVYGDGSLFNGVMKAMGLRNAWQRPTNAWGFSLVGIEALAEEKEAVLVHVGPIPADPKERIDLTPLWSYMPFVRHRRIVGLPSIWYFGALTSAYRFATALTAELFRLQSSDGSNSSVSWPR